MPLINSAETPPISLDVPRKISNANIDKLVAAMARYKKDFEMKIYPGAAHAFFNNTNKHLYNKAAAKDSWKRVKGFFKLTLKS